MTDWLATILIFLPLAGAILIWLLPFGRFAGPVALLFALAEIGFWITALGQMNFDQSGGTPNFDQQWTWFSDLGVSYHVGFYAFSFWLAGLAVVVMAAAIAYGFWVGRERPSAYFGLMLFLTSAVVGVFASQDLLLFYVFFEAMMIPLYVLIGVWGGPGRLGATVKFVIYTMAGSLLMLAAVIVFGLQQGSFDLISTTTSNSTWLFLGFAIAFAIKAPLFPFHGWLPDAYRESSPEVAAVLSGVISKAAVFGFIRICFVEVPGALRRLAQRRSRARRSRARLRLAPRLPRPGRSRRDRILEPRADGADHDRRVRQQHDRHQRRDPPDRQPRADLGCAVPARRDRSSAARRREFRAARRHGTRTAGTRDRAHGDRDHRPRGAGLLGVRR